MLTIKATAFALTLAAPAAIVVVLLFAFVLLTRCRKGHPELHRLRGWSYAHRGLHGQGVPENSMAAFRKALEAGYGVEFDVHLLADGNLAVIHDSALKRTTGAEGIVEDLKAEDLSRYKLEGSDNTIPLFSQVLELFDGKAPLIIELKWHKNNYKILCETVCRALDGYQGVYCLESFDPRCIRWLRKNRPDIIRGQLTENYFKSSHAKAPALLKFVLIHQLLNFLTFPDFVAYRFSDRKCISNFIVEKVWKAQSVVWTLKSMQEHEQAEAEGRIPIFEHYLP